MPYTSAVCWGQCVCCCVSDGGGDGGGTGRCLLREISQLFYDGYCGVHMVIMECDSGVASEGGCCGNDCCHGLRCRGDADSGGSCHTGGCGSSGMRLGHSRCLTNRHSLR